MSYMMAGEGNEEVVDMDEIQRQETDQTSDIEDSEKEPETEAGEDDVVEEVEEEDDDE